MSRTKWLAAISLASVATACVFLSTQSPSSAQPAAPPLAKPGEVGRFQIAPGRDKEDMFLVIDTTDGRVWGYTSRFALGYDWHDYGIPGKRPKSETDEKK